MSDFKAVYQIRSRWGGGAYSASPDSLAVFKGPASERKKCGVI